MADAVFELDAFEGDPRSKMYPDFEGLFLLHKLPRVNSLNVAKRIETLDIGFQLKKNSRYFEVDKLFLPPEDEEAPSRANAPSCSSSSSNIDF